jgi:CBS domain-containing protein
VTPEIPLVEVVSLMRLYRFSGLPLVDQGELVGVIAEKDVLASMSPTLDELMEGGMANVDMDEIMGRYTEVARLKVADVMLSHPVSETPDMHVLRAAAVMAKRKFRRIPGAEDGKLVGMVSLGDVHKAIFQGNIAQTLAPV